MNINPSVINIFIYGDSLTWGRIPNKQTRLECNKRYTGVCQKALGKKYNIIENGLRGRMAYGKNPFFKYKNGYTQFKSALLTVLPIDMLVIFLGTNDTNKLSNLNPTTIAKNLEKYIYYTNKLCEDNVFKTPVIMFISPPPIEPKNLKQHSMFENSYTKLKPLNKEIENMCHKNKVHFLSAYELVKPGIDGVHLDEHNNQILGTKLAEKINKIKI